jgi:hypothetical protein
MIRLQIVERPGSDLFAKLKEAMGTGNFRTLIPMKRGRRIVHKTYPGWMNWSHKGGGSCARSRTLCLSMLGNRARSAAGEIEVKLACRRTSA